MNYPQDANGLPDGSTSVGKGASFLQNTILSDQLHGLGSTVFGYSQSSTLAGVTMRLLDPNGVDESGTTNAPNFLLIADPSNPNGGLLERFNGFETISGHTTVDPLNLPSLGLAFDVRSKCGRIGLTCVSRTKRRTVASRMTFVNATRNEIPATPVNSAI